MITNPIAVTLEHTKVSLQVNDNFNPLYLPRIIRNYYYCAIDAINGKSISSNILLTSSDRIVEIKGWAFDDDSNGCAGGVYISVNNKVFTADYGFDREDLVKAFKNNKVLNSGFIANIEAQNFKKGDNEIIIIYLTSDRRAYYSAKFTVKLF